MAVIGLGLSLLLYVVPSENKVLWASTTVISVLIIFVMSTLFHAAYSAWSGHGQNLPKVIRTCDAPEPYGGSRALLLLTPHPIFIIGAQASVYGLADGVELLIGVGRVVEIQEDSNIQLLTIPVAEGSHQRLIDSKKENLASLIVKPGVSTSIRDFSEANES
jgi:hypothetical protein